MKSWILFIFMVVMAKETIAVNCFDFKSNAFDQTAAIKEISTYLSNDNFFEQYTCSDDGPSSNSFKAGYLSLCELSLLQELAKINNDQEKAKKVCELSKKVCGRKDYEYCNQNDRKYQIPYCPDGMTLFEQNRAQFKYANSYFKRIVSDSKYIQRCCGTNNKKCDEIFSSSKLKFIDIETSSKSLPSPYSAYVNAGTNEVSLSFSYVSKCATTGCLERVILHELGHVCSYAHSYNEGNPNYYQLEKTDFYDKALTYQIGNKNANCIKNVIENNLKDSFNLIRKEEIFAEILFVDSYDMAGLYELCTSREDDSHIDPQKYLHCLTDRITSGKTCPNSN